MTGRIALTGATGFVGQHLLSGLLEEGYSVRALVRTPGRLHTHPALEDVHADLETVTEEFVNGVDAVIHLAGLIKARNRASYARVNVKQAGRLAAMSQAANVPKFICLSSMAAREPSLSTYAWSKSEGDLAVRDAYKGALNIIRAPAVFGPGDSATEPIFDLVSKGWMPQLSGKSARLSVIYVKDLVRVILAAIDGEIHDTPLEPASIASLTWSDFAQAAGEAIGKNVRVLPIPPLLSYPFAAVTSASIALGGPGHLGLGKLREFRHHDWTAAHPLDNPTPLVTALRETAASYEK